MIVLVDIQCFMALLLTLSLPKVFFFEKLGLFHLSPLQNRQTNKKKLILFLITSKTKFIVPSYTAGILNH